MTMLRKVSSPFASCEHSKSVFRTHKNCKCIARIYYIPFALFELKLDRALRLHAVVLFVRIFFPYPVDRRGTCAKDVQVE